MSQNRFEQLIEYVINDENEKAKALFHDIVVEKSRSIYENLMSEEAEEESVDEGREEEEESVEEAREEEEESLEEDDAMGRSDVYDGALGGDQSDNLIKSVEAEEEGVMMDDDDEFGDEEPIDGDEGGEDLEDRVVDLEDKLDELMAEFEQLMGGEHGEAEFDIDAGDDGMTDLEVQDDEYETEGLEEAVSLKSAPKPVTSEEGSVNKKTTTAFNSGAAGMAAKPVRTGGDSQGKLEAAGAYSNKPKDIGVKAQNEPAQSTVKLSPATKPHLAQATQVNTRSPLPGGRG
jgi:hypothetical protein